MVPTSEPGVVETSPGMTGTRARREMRLDVAESIAIRLRNKWWWTVHMSTEVRDGRAYIEFVSPGFSDSYLKDAERLAREYKLRLEFGITPYIEDRLRVILIFLPRA
jgi:hypothetical protein